LVGVGMVTAVYRNPFPGDRPGTEPQPEAEHVAQGGMQDQATVRLVTVQVQRHPEKHGLDGEKGHQHVAPPRQVHESKRYETHPDDLRRLLRESGAEAYGKTMTAGRISVTSRARSCRCGCRIPSACARRRRRRVESGRESPAAGPWTQTGATL